MKKAAAQTLRIIGWSVIAASIAGGIALGAIFRMPDYDAQGRPIMVFDFWLTLCVWLAGIIIGCLIIGKAWYRK